MASRQIFDQKAQSTGFSTAFRGAHTTMYVFDAFGDIYVYKNLCDGYAQRFRAKVAQVYQEHVSGSGPGLALSRLCET